MLKSKSSNAFWKDDVTNAERRQIAGESRQKLRVLTAKTRDCWTEVHQIWTQCNMITAIEHFESGVTIGQSVVKCQGKSKGRCTQRRLYKFLCLKLRGN